MTTLNRKVSKMSQTVFQIFQTIPGKSVPVAEHGDHAGRRLVVLLLAGLGRSGGRVHVPAQIASQLFQLIDGRGQGRLPLKGGEAFPPFIYIHLPNDHMTEPRPQDGYPYEASYVADMRSRPLSTSRVKMLACHTYAICKLGTSSKAPDQSARVSPEIVVSVWPAVRCFM
jgi:hypothetical protein